MSKRSCLLHGSVALWNCSACQRWLPASEYYKDRRQTGDIKSQCKRCHLNGAVRTRDPERKRENNKGWMRRDRAAHRDKYRDRASAERFSPDTRHKVLARQKLSEQVRKGKILRPNICSRCASGGSIQAHHPDYGKPLLVEWLCVRCHAVEDSEKHKHKRSTEPSGPFFGGAP